MMLEDIQRPRPPLDRETQRLSERYENAKDQARQVDLGFFPPGRVSI